MSTTADPVSSNNDSDREIIAGPGRYYRNARYLMAVMCLVMAGWFGYDGLVKWPREQLEAARITADGGTPQTKPHSDFDINLQIILASTLPLAGLSLLFWMLYNSRGQYRLADNALHVPGHPPVPLENIRQIDETRFERKGIIYIDYDVPGASDTARLKLDDFVYDQKATDAIFKQIKTALVPEPVHAADEPGGFDVIASAEPDEAEPREGA